MADKDKLVKDILKRYDNLKTKRSLWEPLWEELAQYIVPKRTGIVAKLTPGEKKTRKVYDSTAIDANDKLAASMHGALTGPTTRWFSMKLRQQELNEIPAVMLWLQDASMKMFLAIQQSNFNGEIQEVYTDLSAFGTGVILVDEAVDRNNKGQMGLRFEAYPIGSYVIDEDAFGRVNVFIRHFELSRHAIASRFGKDKLPQKDRDALDKDPDTKLPVVHAIVPREQVPPISKRSSPSTSLPYASYYILDKQGDNNTTRGYMLKEGGYHEFPVAVVRWSKAAGEMYGRGRGEIALGDVKTLNRAVQMRFKAWAKAIDPPLLVKDKGIIGRVKIGPASLNTIREDGAIEALESKSRFDVSNFSEERLQLNIQRTFFNDQLQLPDKTIITATEADRRIELMQRILGPTLGRLDRELLNMVIKRAYKILERANAFLPVPPVLQAQGGNLDIEFDGPLARAQRISQMTALERFVAGVIPLAEAEEGILDNINFDEYVRVAAESTTIPASILRSKEEVGQIRKQREEAQKALLEREQMMQAAEAAGKAAPAIQASGDVVGAADVILGQAEEPF